VYGSAPRKDAKPARDDGPNHFVHDAAVCGAQNAHHVGVARDDFGRGHFFVVKDAYSVGQHGVPDSRAKVRKDYLGHVEIGAGFKRRKAGASDGLWDDCAGRKRDVGKVYDAVVVRLPDSRNRDGRVFKDKLHDLVRGFDVGQRAHDGAAPVLFARRGGPAEYDVRVCRERAGRDDVVFEVAADVKPRDEIPLAIFDDRLNKPHGCGGIVLYRPTQRGGRNKGRPAFGYVARGNVRDVEHGVNFVGRVAQYGYVAHGDGGECEGGVASDWAFRHEQTRGAKHDKVDIALMDCGVEIRIVKMRAQYFRRLCVAAAVQVKPKRFDRRQ